MNLIIFENLIECGGILKNYADFSTPHYQGSYSNYANCYWYLEDDSFGTPLHLDIGIRMLVNFMSNGSDSSSWFHASFGVRTIIWVQHG
jgi:hypothetical protein